MKIAFLGPKGSYSHQATLLFLDKIKEILSIKNPSVVQEALELVQVASIEALFKADTGDLKTKQVEDKNEDFVSVLRVSACDYVVVPVENCVGGVVPQALDAMAEMALKNSIHHLV